MDMSTASQHDPSGGGDGGAGVAARSWYDHQQRLLENPPAPCLPASEDVETYLPTLDAGAGRGHRYFGAAHTGYAPAHPSDWGCEYRDGRWISVLSHTLTDITRQSCVATHSKETRKFHDIHANTPTNYHISGARI